jgi:hypothetical protein
MLDRFRNIALKAAQRAYSRDSGTMTFASQEQEQILGEFLPML